MNRTIHINSKSDIDEILGEIKSEWKENTIVFHNGGYAAVFKKDLDDHECFLKIGNTYTLTQIDLYYYNPDGADGKDIWSFAEVELE